MRKLYVALAILLVVLLNSNVFAEYENFKPIIANMLLQKIPVNTTETIKLKKY